MISFSSDDYTTPRETVSTWLTEGSSHIVTALGTATYTLETPITLGNSLWMKLWMTNDFEPPDDEYSVTDNYNQFNMDPGTMIMQC
jgi:hypothetical protein